jgi:hypothetical protein
MESYILTQTMHLGYLKESFGRGAVIKFNPDTNKMTIDGRSFDDHRDLEILKRQALKKPHAPWVVPFSEEVLQDIRGGSVEAAPAVVKRASNGDGLAIVQSDEDTHETIDIRDTKVSARNQERKDAERQKVKTEGLEIIQGDESVEERISRLKGAKDTDIAARAERVRLMAAEKQEMPIIHDDSQGVGDGSSAAMNAGQPVGGRRSEEAPENVSAAAEARKVEVEQNRQKTAADQGLDPDQAGIDEVTPSPAEAEPVLAEVETAPALAETTGGKSDRIAALKAELAKLEGEEAPASPKKIKKTPVVEGS